MVIHFCCGRDSLVWSDFFKSLPNVALALKLFWNIVLWGEGRFCVATLACKQCRISTSRFVRQVLLNLTSLRLQFDLLAMRRMTIEFPIIPSCGNFNVMLPSIRKPFGFKGFCWEVLLLLETVKPYHGWRGVLRALFILINLQVGTHLATRSSSR